MTLARFARVLPVLAFGAVFAQVAALGLASARDPQAGDFIEYRWSRHVGSGDGEYEGYTDDTRSEARLDILTANATHASLRSAYTWTYSSSEGEHMNGAINRVVEFNLTTRRWTSLLTDDDEHDGQDASTFAVWFWIPTDGIQVGDQFEVVDDVLTVASLRSTVWSNWLPKVGVELVGRGTFLRDDEYGVYSVTYEDTYYYDPVTGFVIAERYSERDRGTWNGLPAEFTWTEAVDVVASSYAIEIDGVAVALTFVGIGIIVGLLGLVVYGIRWRSREAMVRGTGNVRVRRLRNLADFPGVTGGDGRRSVDTATLAFGPFLQDFARKALLARDIVAVAAHKGDLVGLAVFSKDAKVGQIFARDTGLAETFRAFVGARDFFSEFRHPVPESAIRSASGAGVKIPPGDAYNLLDAYHVLRLGSLQAVTYDAGLVRRMRADDLRAVFAIAERVYRVDSRRWLRAQLASGDLGYVACLDGRVVGFAFATLVDGAGRLHTLTVLPEHRNKGIGRELLRARLHALRALGARDVISEVGSWNIPSLHLASAHGFVKIGDLWVETARRQPARFGLQRR